jgi:hypothetical protein
MCEKPYNNQFLAKVSMNITNLLDKAKNKICILGCFYLGAQK